LIADSLALSTFDLASACFGALRRQAGGSQANDSGLPEAGNGRSLGLNRLPFGGCRLKALRPQRPGRPKAPHDPERAKQARRDRFTDLK
jgi:hypothetical protein